MNIYKRVHRSLWLGMAIIFVLGVFFSMKCTYPVLKNSIHRESAADAKVMAVESEYKVGDFCTNSTNYRSRIQQTVFGNIREAILCVMFVFYLFAYWCVIRYRWFCTEKKVPKVPLVCFIHRSDGKKRICFVAYMC